MLPKKESYAALQKAVNASDFAGERKISNAAGFRLCKPYCGHIMRADKRSAAVDLNYDDKDKGRQYRGETSPDLAR